MAPDSSYDDQGKHHHAPDAVLAVISRMRIGQKILILEQKKGEDPRPEKVGSWEFACSCRSGDPLTLDRPIPFMNAEPFSTEMNY